MAEDRIEIHKLEIFARHGVYQQENDLGQKFYLSAKLYMPVWKAAENDDIREAVNYADVCGDLVRWMQEKYFKLIETAAQHCAYKVLDKYKMISRIILDLEKPSAPMAYHTDTVLVHIERSRHQAFISFGSNMGDRRQYIDAAIKMLDEAPDMSVLRVSPIINTKAYGKEDQDDFLNGCLLLETFCSPEELLVRLNRIESALGRVRHEHWGPRTIDLDIIFYDDLVMDTPSLHIPHIDMQNRLFVLEPLSQIGGWYRHPRLNLTVDELLARLKES